MGLISNNVLRIELHNKFWAVIASIENLFWNLFTYNIILEMSPMSLTFFLQAVYTIIYSNTVLFGQMT